MAAQRLAEVVKKKRVEEMVGSDVDRDAQGMPSRRAHSLPLPGFALGRRRFQDKTADGACQAPVVEGSSECAEGEQTTTGMGEAQQGLHANHAAADHDNGLVVEPDGFPARLAPPFPASGSPGA